MDKIKLRSDTIKQSFAKNLKEIRKHVGLTLKELEALTNINNPSLSRYENGKVEPTLSQAMIIASAFLLNISDFVEDPEDEFDISEQYPICDVFDSKIASFVEELGDKYKNIIKEKFKKYNFQYIEKYLSK